MRDGKYVEERGTCKSAFPFALHVQSTYSRKGQASMAMPRATPVASDVRSQDPLALEKPPISLQPTRP